MPLTQTYEANSPILKQVSETIDKHAMLAPGDKVLVGVSGGPDSVALLHLLSTLSPVYKIKLAVAHLNHGLRPHADHKETAHVEQMAGALGLTFHLEEARLETPRGSLEERARDVRYAFFNSLAKTHGYTKIALGHQADDDAEAVLLHLFRGSGLRGLSGIPPVRDNRIVRPLIDLRRKDILAYLAQSEIPFVIDESNKDLRFDRNRIRHHLLPLLKEQYNPNIVNTLHRMAGLCRDEDQWLDHHLQPLQARIETEASPEQLILDLTPLGDQPPAVQRRLFRSVLRRWRGDLKRISAHHVEALIRLSSPGCSQGRLNLPGGLAAERHCNSLQFTYLDNPRHFPSVETPLFCHAINTAHDLPSKIGIPEAGATLTFDISTPPISSGYRSSDNHSAWFDLEQLNFPLYIRCAAPGDRFSPLGTQGSQKIKQLFVDRKIPRNLRSRAPILASAGTIYWVAGLRRSSAALITPTTTQALCISCQYHDALMSKAFK